MLIWINILSAAILVGLETRSVPYAVAVLCALQSIMLGLEKLEKR